VKACPNCFQDHYLEHDVLPPLLGDTGSCDFCGARSVRLFDPAQLRDRFDSLLSLYREDDAGFPLAELLRREWKMFPALPIAAASSLVSSIYEDPQMAIHKFSPHQGSARDSGLDSWTFFREELLHQNRFFVRSPLDLEQLRRLLKYLSVGNSALPPRLFRARIQESKAAFTLTEMGPPPHEKTSSGRVNPPGIPYLYLADAAKTAISEIRPQVGELVTVAEFQCDGGLLIADLRNPRASASPFKVDEEELPALHQYLAFFDQLGIELTRPIDPKTAHIEYLPSQYLCELMKDCRFDGVMYRSSVSSGTNVALFNPARAVAIAISTHLVTQVEVTTSVEGC
jgi:RES domain-containing protein